MIAAEEYRPGAVLKAAIGGRAGADGHGVDLGRRRELATDVDVADVGHGVAELRQPVGEAGGPEGIGTEPGATAGRAGISRQPDQVDTVSGGRTAGAGIVQHFGSSIQSSPYVRTVPCRRKVGEVLRVLSRLSKMAAWNGK